MCLAVPGRIVQLRGTKAVVDFGGVKREADISLLPEVRLGEYVLVHVGFAIQRVDEARARETYRLLAASSGAREEPHG